VRTSDVAYLRAKLPSWINALVTTIRDFELFKIVKNCNSLWTSDFALLPVWPCSFGYRSWVVMGLLIKFISSFITFLVIFFCRATSLVLGGPGPGAEVRFPMQKMKKKKIAPAIPRHTLDAPDP
jgi:hypothetical protein